ncbi:MAG: hypothetical protein KF809_04650 [Chloroflexi bacterium]|nr:hypothetical protein [Chloroflexota bacterium]
MQVEPGSSDPSPSVSTPSPGGGADLPRRFGIVIALLMATVSIVSAVVASRAAFWSAAAGDLGGQALQEVLERQQIEDDLRTSVDADTRLVGRYDAAWKRTQLLQTQADELRATDADAAASLDIEAQGEFGIDVALWRFFTVIFPRYGFDEELVFEPEAVLAALRAGEPRLAELSRSDAAVLAAQAKDRTSTLVAVAAVFVASLFVLTVAEVTSGRRRRIAFAAGVTLALAATLLSVTTDLDSGGFVVGTVVVALGVILLVIGGPSLARRRRAARALARVSAVGVEHVPDSGVEVEGTPGGEVEGPSDADDRRAAGTGLERGPDAPADPGVGEPSSRFAGTIGVLLAGATLLGAIVGYYQGVASDAGDRAAAEARDQALRALTEHQSTNQWATTQVEQWTQVLEQRARAVMARQTATYWGGHGDAALAARQTAEAAHRTALADRAARLTDLSADHPDGPDRDPDFPLRFRASQGEQAARRVVLQDLANEANAHHSTVSAGHVAVLATIAIAAYLLGLSLVLDDRRSQRLFGVVGVGLLVAAGGWALANEVGTPARPDPAQREAIATAYARASVTAATARTPAQWRAAEAAYRAVLELHPTLARARVGLASAVFAAASPQTGGGFTSVSSIDAIRDAAHELEVARDLGWETLITLGDGGFYETLLALDDPDGGHAAKALELTAAAVDRAPDLPVVRFNHAAALLVAGRIDAARATYLDGVALAMAPGADGDPVLTEGQRWNVAAGALTDLELIAASLADDPTIGPAIPEMRALVVAGLGDPITHTDPGTQPVMSDLAVWALSSQLWWTARIDDFDADHDVMSVVWSYEDPLVPGRHVLATHSGPVRLGTETDAGSFYIDAELPRYWQGRSYLLGSAPHRCVPDGTYQVEVYLNGRLATEPAVAVIDLPELATVSRRDMQLLLCHPEDWLDDGQEDGSRASFRSPDGSMGMTVMRMFRPRSLTDDGAGQSRQVMAELMADWPGAPQAMFDDPVSDYFMGLDEAYTQWYDTADTRLKVTAGIDALGTVFVAVLDGPADWVDGELANGILGSFSRQ